MTTATRQTAIEAIQVELETLPKFRCPCGGSGYIMRNMSDTLDVSDWQNVRCNCTPEQLEEGKALRAKRDELERQIKREENALRPQTGRMARVVKGRKLPKGDYQCVRMGNGQYGPYVVLRDAQGKDTLVNQENVVGLHTCPYCGVSGRTEEIAWDYGKSLCGPCVDREYDESPEVSPFQKAKDRQRELLLAVGRTFDQTALRAIVDELRGIQTDFPELAGN